MNNSKTPNKLGRGLEGLLGNDPLDFLSEPPENIKRAELDVSEIFRFENQPRKYFDEDSLKSLVDSINNNGVLQPILVRPHKEVAGKYQLIAGERRWRAAQKAGLQKIPAIIKNVSDADAAEISLIENIQRENLTPIEEAKAYQTLMDNNDYTQEALAQKISKSRSAVANSLRLLNLPESVQEKIKTGNISAGHARNLVGRENASELAEQIVAQKLSVRDVERKIQQKKIPKSVNSQNPNVKNLERSLEQALGLKVQIKNKGESGILSLHYKNLDQFENLSHLLLRE